MTTSKLYFTNSSHCLALRDNLWRIFQLCAKRHVNARLSFQGLSCPLPQPPRLCSWLPLLHAIVQNWLSEMYTGRQPLVWYTINVGTMVKGIDKAVERLRKA